MTGHVPSVAPPPGSCLEHRRGLGGCKPTSGRDTVRPVTGHLSHSQGPRHHLPWRAALLSPRALSSLPSRPARCCVASGPWLRRLLRHGPSLASPRTGRCLREPAQPPALRAACLLLTRCVVHTRLFRGLSPAPRACREHAGASERSFPS